MLRKETAAALVLVLLAASGCGDQQSAGVGSGPGGLSFADASPNGGDFSSNLSQLQDAAPAAASAAQAANPGSQPSSNEALAAAASRTFDGTRGTGLGSSAAPVVAGSLGGWSRVTPAKPNARSRKVGLDKGGVPAPGTLPSVDLPGPENAAETSAGAKGGGPVLLAFEAFEKKFYDSLAPVFSRKAWHAHAASNSGAHQTPTRVTVHHTDGKQTFDEAETLAAVRNIQAFHMGSDPKHGWDDIGYHFLIDGAGRIVEGRHTDIMGAHAHGYNENNVGIALIGDYNRDKPTAAQVDSLRRLVTFLALKYRTDPRQKGFLEPHQHYNDTDCPGKNVVAILQQLGQEIDNDTINLAQRLQPGAPSSAGDFQPLFVAQR